MHRLVREIARVAAPASAAAALVIAATVPSPAALGQGGPDMVAVTTTNTLSGPSLKSTPLSA